MDLVRGVCILLVIFFHTSTTMQKYGLPFPDYIAVFNQFMDPFRIPLLMFLSGMLLERSLAKPNREFLTGKFNLIFWPFLVWSQFIYAADGRFTLEYILKTPITAPTVLWYLWFLFAYYLIGLFLTRRRIPLVPVMVICLVLSELLPAYLRMDRFAALLFFFLLGHYVTANRFSMNGRGAVGLIGLGFATAGGLISVQHGAIKYDPWFVWVPMGLIAFLLWAAPFYQRGAVTRVFEWIGRNSIVFYAAHFPLLLVCTGLAAAHTEVTGAGLYVGLFLVVLVLCAGLQQARQHRPSVAALFDFSVARRLLSGHSGKPTRAL
jgi:surface polysaccharide O-acyltransferase-like enzyme